MVQSSSTFLGQADPHSISIHLQKLSKIPWKSESRECGKNNSKPLPVRALQIHGSERAVAASTIIPSLHMGKLRKLFALCNPEVLGMQQDPSLGKSQPLDYK